MSSVLEKLNPEQRLGAETVAGPVLVIAGAGSGKTRMLTARIVHLIQTHGVMPNRILAVTFTNKAAGEMRARVNKALGWPEEAPRPYAYSTFGHQPNIGTFHSICVQLLRREIERTPFDRQFVIYDDSDQLSLIKECFSKLNLSDKAYSPKSFQWAINSAKCWVQSPSEVNATEQFKNLYALYEQELIKANAVDFGEIILLAYKLLKENPDVLEKYQNQFQYIHVDEYQDTNRAQYLLIQLLAGKHRNLCVVGDEDQSIYKWRGADIKNILDFEKDYPDAQVIKLEQNYRSTQIIVEASSALIGQNTSRKAKKLWTENERGTPIFRFQVTDDRMESEIVVGQMKKICENGFAYSDIAVFYRTNAQSRVFEDVMRRERIPYKVVGGLRFYDRKEIKDILAYFRIFANPTDSLSYKRIINVPQRSIGKSTVEKIDDYAAQQNFSFHSALNAVSQGEVLSGAARKKVSEFVALIGELKEISFQRGIAEFFHELLDRTGYVKDLKDEGTDEALARVENLQEFDNILREFEARYQTEGNDLRADVLLPQFLENVTLVGEESAENEEIGLATGSVSMMTLHTSKGLEFPVVFLVGCEEGLFPSIRPYESGEEEIEEERRLCYVGMTRARRVLYMTNAVCRRIYGNIVYHEPARFFAEIPEDFIQFHDLSQFRSRFRDSDSESSSRSHSDSDSEYSSSPRSNAELLPPPNNGFTVGMKVKHDAYGVGIIRVTETDRVTVDFGNHNVKKFLIKFANLQPL